MELVFVVLILQHQQDKNQFEPIRSAPGLSSDPPRHMLYRRGDGDDREDMSNRS